MGCYTGLFTVDVAVGSLENFQLIITDILDDCGCEIIYILGDYLMARESHNQVSFSQLVTIEMTFSRANLSTQKIRMNIVVRNEKLPLKLDNHCYQVFILLSRLIAENLNWKLLESMI